KPPGWHNLNACCARALRRSPRGRAAALAAAFGLAVLWAHAPTLAGLVRRWSTDPQSSHGFLVPAFAPVVLWARRPRGTGPDGAAAGGLRPSRWGLPWLLGGAALRLAAAAFYLEALDALSLLPTLAGLCVLLGGPPALRRA